MSSLSDHSKPFLKWAGGKRWLLARYRHLLPCDYQTYIEPFFGGGAIFFGLHPNQAILADSNVSLIACYKAIKSNWKTVWRYLKVYDKAHSDDFYYLARDQRHRSEFREAARFIYLNRTCFNGIYRENLKGKFNVPRGTKDTVVFLDDNFSQISSLLQKATLQAQDFSLTLSKAGKGDFAFVDPPYTVRHNMNGFVKYNQKIFSWEDQVRLKVDIHAAAQRGAKIFVTNANHASIRELYKGIGRFYVLCRKSVIAGSTDARGNSTELGIAIGYDANPHVTATGVIPVSATRESLTR